ncbi:MBL fold metallo-hydrolase [Patescibacteria group bacterium]|nr:MBL fold metallo-hydrolase [Patescibacteria group bacterium]MBU1931702.1 MBL fold metallo-hydrolase [Patescibacteria group bacterium]
MALSTMPVKTLIVGQLQTNCYLFYSEPSRKAVIIDPGDDADLIISQIQDLDLNPEAILATHGHFDHVLAVTELKLAFNLPFYLHQADKKILARTQSTAKYFTGLEVDPAPKVYHSLVPQAKIKVGESSLQIIHTPGHTQGSVCFYCPAEKLIFTGDLIFAHGDRGRTDLDGGNESQIQQSIRQILSLPAKTLMYSGHGPATTVKDEKQFH